jgi:hypothetical protein
MPRLNSTLSQDSSLPPLPAPLHRCKRLSALVSGIVLIPPRRIGGETDLLIPVPERVLISDFRIYFSASFHANPKFWEGRRLV